MALKRIKKELINAENLTGDISRIYGDASNISGDVTSIYGDVSGIRGDVSGIKGNVSEIYGDVSRLRGNVTDISGAVTGIRGYVSEIHGNVSNISGNVSDIRGDVSGICGNVSGIYGDMTGIEGDVSDIYGDMSDICGDVTGTEGDDTGLTGDVDDIFKDLSTGVFEAVIRFIDKAKSFKRKIMKTVDAEIFKTWADKKGLHKTRDQEEYTTTIHRPQDKDFTALHATVKIKWSDIDKKYHATFIIANLGFEEGMFLKCSEHYPHACEFSLASVSDEDPDNAWKKMLETAEFHTRQLLGIGQNDNNVDNTSPLWYYLTYLHSLDI